MRKTKQKDKKKKNNRQPKHAVPSVSLQKQYLFIFRKNKFKKQKRGFVTIWLTIRSVIIHTHALLIGFIYLVSTVKF